MGQKSCPLTDTQTQKAIAAWAKIAAFLTSEPRCVNCHGKVNPYVDGVGLDPNDPFKDPEAPVSTLEHGGGKQARPKDSSGMDQGCKKCHDAMAPKGQFVDIHDNAPEWPEGSPLQNWTTAPNFLSFVDRDATTLCRQIKRATGTAAAFTGHLKYDEGGFANFAGTAYLGNRGLDKDNMESFNVAVQRPSITHAALMQMGQDWIYAMGGKFQGDEGCGCEVRHALWSGQIRYAVQESGDDGHNDLQDWSNRLLSTVTVTVTNGVGITHRRLESDNEQENRHKVATGGYLKESSSSHKISANATAPTALYVAIDEAHGTYEIRMDFAKGKDGRPIYGQNKIDEHFSQCYTSDCKSWEKNTTPQAMPGVTNLAGLLSGKLTDRDHIHASYYAPPKKTRGAGTRIEMMTVDLWRSGSN